MQTIEINGSHYALQSPQSYANWCEATPRDFIFSVKGPRYLTHMLRFRGNKSDTALANFFASGIFNLHQKLLPDRKRKLRHAIEIRHTSFCDKDFIRLLRKYRAALVISDSVADWPYAEDVTSDFVYLRLHGTEVLYGGKYRDSALDWWAARITDWAGGREPRDAQRIYPQPARRRAQRDVFCYFDNDQKAQAPFDARRLIERLHA